MLTQRRPAEPSITSLSVSGIFAEDIDVVWPDVRGYLLKAIQYADGKYTEESVVQSLKSRQMQLWVAWKDELLVAGITTICEYPGKKVCNLMFTGGRRMDEWVESLSTVEQWAKSMGCESIEVWGRKGWERVLSDYDVIHTVIRKQL